MTAEEAAAEIRAQDAVRPRGGGTKLGWSPKTDAVDFDTRRLNRILEHNEGDFTAILEAGVSVVEAQAQFAAAGQMLAIDPPLGAGDAATIGGVMATNDSGPLRHRYGTMRDLVVGVTVVLSDGTIAQSGGKVIKNVAGYDLAKLFTGSYGTLGLIVRVAVRLHPAPERTATVTARSDDPASLAAAARHLAALPLEADCLDVTWEGDSGRLDVRFGGATAHERAHEATRHLDLPAEIDDDDHDLWARQRARQRGDVVVKVSGRPTDLESVIAAAGGARVVSRAALGISYVADADVAALRDALAPRACTVLDGADRIDDPWPAVDPGALAVMERIKARFDPARTFRPGAFVGGL
ncbi:MAG TPA: FAD-binding oxidoreductase [Solirubrobacteraceae bacterium]|nr:FAD-binding oxidoreductase [Solirubrobacteraceae bacterium]